MEIKKFFRLQGHTKDRIFIKGMNLLKDLINTIRIHINFYKK